MAQTDVETALSEISALRLQTARSSQFRGFRPGALAATGGLALAAAAVQPHIAPEPLADIGAYVGLWAGTAAACAGLVA